MADETNTPTKCCHGRGKGGGAAAGGGIYGLAFLGALVYYIQHSATFWAGVLGVLKALIWPALIVYKLLGFLKL